MKKKSCLAIGGLPAHELAEEFGTPLYVYDAAVINHELAEWAQILSAHPRTRLCYAVKANSSLKLLHHFAQRGLSFDIVSGGELARLLRVGVAGERIVFSGVGKSVAEIEAALSANIYCFNIESIAEIHRLTEIGQAHGVVVPVAIRINPDIDAKTHPYISTGLTENKFGLTLSSLQAGMPFLTDNRHIAWHGLDCHIGSNMSDPAPYLRAAETLLSLASQLIRDGVPLRHLDFGGGVGVRYRPEDARPVLSDFITPILQRANNLPLELIFEPGRRLIAEAGTLLTTVDMIKTTPARRFVIVDAAMNDLLRPALYQAYHDIVPAWLVGEAEAMQEPAALCDIVGPVCESADFLGKGRMLAVREGDGLAIKTAGAYSFAMASNYNTRPRSAEIWVEDGQATEIRPRETYDDLFRNEVF